MRSSVVPSLWPLLFAGILVHCAAEDRVQAGATPPGVSTAAATGASLGNEDKRAYPPAAAQVAGDLTEAEPKIPDPDAPTAPSAKSELEMRASWIMAAAVRQIERLNRLNGSDGIGASAKERAAQQSIDSALADLESKREKVLQDLRATAMRTLEQGPDAERVLGRDAAELLSAVNATYALAEPSSRDLPGPAPLPPQSP